MAENRTLKGIYGEAGAAYVTHGNTITGEFCAVTSLHDTTNITLTWSELNKDIQGDATGGTTTAFSTVTVPAGVTIYGQFTSVVIGSSSSTTGKAIAYNASK